MLLGFKRQFAPFVEAGTKTHTIRGTRKITPRVGETCHCYVDPRQKTMRLLGRFLCVKVDEIAIGPARHGRSDGDIWINGVALDRDECNELAWRDGFRTFGRKRAFSEMMRFWEGRLPFDGHIIHWRWDEETAGDKGRFMSATCKHGETMATDAEWEGRDPEFIEGCDCCGAPMHMDGPGEFEGDPNGSRLLCSGCAAAHKRGL